MYTTGRFVRVLTITHHYLCSNSPRALHAAVAIAKALQYALTPEGILKRDEIAPGIKAPSPKLNGKANGKASHQNGNAHGPDKAEKHNAAADAQKGRVGKPVSGRTCVGGCLTSG